MRFTRESHLERLNLEKGRFLVFLLPVVFFTCSSDFPLSTDCRDITASLSVEEFEEVKEFILEHGDREVYCNLYNNNPHYAFDRFDAYLNPEVGQGNTNCDPAIEEVHGFIIEMKNESGI